jgi:uncharacterized protein
VPSIRVMAAADVSAKADRADIDIGVVTQASQAREAAAQNTKQLDTVLAALHKAAEHAEIRTVSYSLSPTYRYPSGGEPTVTGYTATNLVRVTLDDLAQVGGVVEAATHSGANRVQDIQFTLRDPESVRVQALREAAGKAKREAQALAGALGLKVSRVLSVDESSDNRAPIRPIVMAAARRAVDEGPPPIEPGSLDISAGVTLTVEVSEPPSQALSEARSQSP